ITSRSRRTGREPQSIIFVRDGNRASAGNAAVHGYENQSRATSKRNLAAGRWHYWYARRGPCCRDIPTCNAGRLVGRTVVVALNAYVLSRIDHLVQSTDVIAMLVAAQSCNRARWPVEFRSTEDRARPCLFPYPCFPPPTERLCRQAFH